MVGTKEGLSYLDVNRIYVDDLSSELDSYVVVCGLDLTKADSTLDTVAYLGDQMPVARIAEDGIYLGRTVTGEGEATSRMIRFEGSNLSSVTESENISGLLIPRSFVSLPDTGCAVLTGQPEGTGGAFRNALFWCWTGVLALRQQSRYRFRPRRSPQWRFSARPC